MFILHHCYSFPCIFCGIWVANSLLHKTCWLLVESFMHQSFPCSIFDSFEPHHPGFPAILTGWRNKQMGLTLLSGGPWGKSLAIRDETKVERTLAMFSCFLSYWLQHSFFRITFNTSLLGAFPLSIFNHIFDKISKPLWWSRKPCDAVRCPDGRWWPGPGCRNDLTKCIPVLTYHGWKLQAIMQWSLGWCWASGTVEPLWWICWLAEALKELIRALSLVISFTFLLSVQFRSTEYCPTYDHFSRLWMFLFEVQHSQSISRTHIHCMLPMPCGHMERPNLASMTLYYTFTGVIKFPLKQCKCMVILTDLPLVHCLGW